MNLTQAGCNFNNMSLSTACTTIVNFDLHKMEAFALERRGLSLLSYFISFCMGKAFVSSLEIGGEKSSLHKMCLFDLPAPNPCQWSMAEGYAQHTKYAAFDVYPTITYSTVNGRDIDLSILVPKGLKPRREGVPLIVRFHGGYLVMGSRLYPDWFQNWILDYAIQKGAIIVAPDYRLLPEARGPDILEDVDSLWRFIGNDLEEVLRSICKVNTTNTLVIGDSAGSHLAVLSALRCAEWPNVLIRAMVSGFGMVDMSNAQLHSTLPESLLDKDPTQLMQELVQRHLDDVDAKEEELGYRPIVTESFDISRRDLGHAILYSGMYGDLLDGPSPNLNYSSTLIDRLDPKTALPAFWLYHGEQDTIVPRVVSDTFVKVLSEKMQRLPNEDPRKVMLTIKDGGHGLDKHAALTDCWVREGLAHIEQYWH